MQLNWKAKGTRQRFAEVISLLCAGDYPPDDYIHDWLDSDDEKLQQWVCCEAGLSYLTGIGIIEAAQFLVDAALENANIDEEGNIR
jgi:hypothetical protein